LDELLGSLAPTGEIPHVPMDIAVPFFLVAVRWVREHGPEIATALEQAERAYAQAAAQGRGVAACEIAAARVLQEFRFEHPPLIDGQRFPEVLTGLLPLRRLVRFAITASFVVVAALTGMRLSELLGLAEDCLERLPLEDGSGDSLLYVRGILLKTASTPRGEPVRWVAGIDGPDNHVRAAIELIRRLTAVLRDHSGEQRLLLNILLRPGVTVGSTIVARARSRATRVHHCEPNALASVGDRVNYRIDQRVDLLLGVGSAQREADTGAGALRSETDRKEDVRGLDRSAGTRRAARDRESTQVKSNDKGLAFQIIEV